MPPLTKAKSSTAFSRGLLRRHKYSDEEVTGSQRCLRKTKPGVHLGTGTVLLRVTTFCTPSYKFTLFSLEKQEMIRRTAGHISPEKAEFSLLVAFASSHQVLLVKLSPLICFLVQLCFPFSQLHLIHFSQHPERNNTKKNVTC